MTGFAAVEDAGIAHGFRQLWRPLALIVQLDGHQQRAIAWQVTGAVFNLMQVFRGGIADAQAFAGGHQPFAQLGIAGQVQIQMQGGLAGFPAPPAEQRQQQARQYTVDQQHPHQPRRPGLAGAVDIQRGIATGADHLHGGHAEPEQRRQCSQGLGHGDEGLATEDSGFPDEAVTPGRHQHQQNHQGAEHRQQPQAVDQHTERPAIEFVSLQ
ncbi:hypothetical protein PS639_06031 [Pseudomonas fluorescens]|nr:hypothetical protein PS639_06031 [Pseudomonas fluorescens]